MNSLFNSKEVREYTSALNNQLKSEIMRFSDQQIVFADLDEWAVYFESKFAIQPIVLFEDNIENSIEETKVRIYDNWRYNIPYGKEHVLVDGYRILYSIPYEGDEALLYLKPTTYIMTSYNPERIEPPRGDNCGRIVLSIEYTASDLKAKENIQDFVWKAFEREFESYKKMIGYVNSDIQGFNQSLKKNARRMLEDRKKKANDFVFVSAALSIPLPKSKNAPNVVPRPLKRIRREPAVKPAFKEPEPSQEITDEDYRNIINIIHSVCTSMEETAKTFSNIEEESLRDFIIATLGTHYENQATGETFRKNGKTDIRVIFDNKAAFIGECKIWHGIKKFEEAIQQLFSYSTWRDVKLSLVVFNKDVKDFKSIQKKIQEWIKSDTKSSTVLNGNVWNCVIHRPDTNEDVKVAIALYDLSV